MTTCSNTRGILPIILAWKFLHWPDMQTCAFMSLNRPCCLIERPTGNPELQSWEPHLQTPVFRFSLIFSLVWDDILSQWISIWARKQCTVPINKYSIQYFSFQKINHHTGNHNSWWINTTWVAKNDYEKIFWKKNVLKFSQNIPFSSGFEKCII